MFLLYIIIRNFKYLVFLLFAFSFYVACSMVNIWSKVVIAFIIFYLFSAFIKWRKRKF